MKAKREVLVMVTDEQWESWYEEMDEIDRIIEQEGDYLEEGDLIYLGGNVYCEAD